ncbi:MAG TPA: VWA domain-containing protein [Blastocatellia bacterium]|nr:VWA domain-containing protein [Blastocatellia bacterium]
MSFKAIRSVFAVFMIAAFIISLLPVTYASQGGQSAQAMRTRRGKNGAASSASAAPQEADRTRQAETDQTEPAAQALDLQDSNPQVSNFQDRNQSQRRSEPPPFDRPPLATGRGTQNDGVSSAPAPSRPQPSQPSTSGPPVLRRPPSTDSRNPDSGGYNTSGDRSRGAPPVLQRPSDPRDPSNRPTQPNAQDDRQDAGQQGPVPGDNDEVVKLEATLVNIPLLVSDRAGRYIPQLNKNDFTLYEDGIQQEIASFGSEEVPFNVVLMLDVSPSVQGNVSDIQDAALAFVRQLRSQDRVMVVSFDRSTNFLTDFTSDRRHLESAIRSVSVGSGTSVYDAVYETVSRRMRNIEGRKALILFSDGEDTTSSHASYDDAVNIVSESDVLVYGLRYPGSDGNVQINPWPRNPIPDIPFPLPFPWPFPRRRRGPFAPSHLNGNDYMTNAAPAAQSRGRRGRGRGNGGDFMGDLTAAGGGPVYDAEQIGDLSRLASRIADELRHVYVVSYYPTNALSNGGFRAIRVRVRNRDDIAVRHRRGYNAGEVNKPTH